MKPCQPLADISTISAGSRMDPSEPGGDRDRQLVERLPVAIYTCNLEGRITFRNSAAVELWGRDPAADDGQFCGAWRIHQPDGGPLPLEQHPMATTLSTGQAVRGEELLIERPDGTHRHILAHCDPIVGADGVMTGAVGMLLDVTDSRRVQQALRDSEQRFRTVAMNAPAAIYVKDRAGRYTFANSLACQALGRPEGVAGLADRDLLSGEAAGLLERHDAEVIESGRVVEYEEVVARDGFFAQYLSVKFPLFDAQGEAIGVCGVSTDITARKRAENARRESDERFARFMRHLPGLAWIKDAAGRYVFANDAAAKAFQMSADDLIGKTDNDVFHADTAAQFIENDRRALDSEAGIQTIETLTHPDGELHYSLVSKFPIPGPEGSPPLIGGMAIDVTSSKRAEESLREADQRKDEFLAMLAHELRNPLAPIRTGLELIRIAGDDAALIEEVRATMERQTQQMVRLIDDLLDVSRITRGTMDLRKTRVELSVVVEQAVEAARPIIEEQGHRLLVELPDQPLLLEADATRLAQVVSNLLNNAAKYMPAGGDVRLDAKRDGQSVVIRVSDRGIGIPPEMLDRIFEMFTQVDRSLERTHGGLGIGLTLVKRLVEMHGGTVRAHSAGPGQGSEFVVSLPLSDTTRGNEKPADSGAASTVGRRVLVVDDNEGAARVLSLLLKAFGNEVRTAHDGLAAIEIAAEFLPDVILMDLGMPRLNGYDAARRIREQPWGKRILLAALTGWGQEDDKARTREAGFDYHFVKPVAAATLQELLSKP
jgi:PAS domain S-box-containing protein